MGTICQHVQERLAAESPLDRDQTAHLAGCGACAEWREGLALLSGAVASSLALPAGVLETHAQAAARSALAQVGESVPARQFWNVPSWTWAAAAALAMTVGTGGVYRAVTAPEPAAGSAPVAQLSRPAPVVVLSPAVQPAAVPDSQLPERPTTREPVQLVASSPTVTQQRRAVALARRGSANSKAATQQDDLTFAMRKTGSGVRLEWQAEPGAEYVVKKCTVLAAAKPACPSSVRVRGSGWTDENPDSAPIVFYTIERS